MIHEKSSIIRAANSGCLKLMLVWTGVSKCAGWRLLCMDTCLDRGYWIPRLSGDSELRILTP